MENCCLLLIFSSMYSARYYGCYCIVLAGCKELCLDSIDDDNGKSLTTEAVQNAAERIVSQFIDLTLPSFTEKEKIRYVDFTSFLTSL